MEKETARLEAFSDGIFGVAITLLALDIGIKEYEQATNTSLWHEIVIRWPEYFTYFNSFAGAFCPNGRARRDVFNVGVLGHRGGGSR